MPQFKDVKELYAKIQSDLDLCGFAQDDPIRAQVEEQFNVVKDALVNYLKLKNYQDLITVSDNENLESNVSRAYWALRRWLSDHVYKTSTPRIREVG